MMEDLLNFILENLVEGKDYKIKTDDNGEYVKYTISVPDDKTGLVIGKGGRTIKAIRKLVKVRATLEKKKVDIEILTP